MYLSAVGDGAFVRAALEGLIEVLKRFAAPTGARGSVLFMWGGLIIIGFLFITFLFRSAIVGDLAPVANARSPAPRVVLPGNRPPAGARDLLLPPQRDRTFERGRAVGRDAGTRLDQALAALHAAGFDVRITLSGPQHKRIRAYRCPDGCGAGGSVGSCEYARGLLVGAFEAVTGDVAKVEEIACSGAGAGHCEFDVRHAPLVQVVA